MSQGVPSIHVLPPTDEDGDQMMPYDHSRSHPHSLPMAEMQASTKEALHTNERIFSNPYPYVLSSGQMSPLDNAGLRDAAAGNLFLNVNFEAARDSSSGCSSPELSSPYSPHSASSGDWFSDNASDVSSSYSPHIEYPNSFPSSPSLSPVHSAFSEFNISEPPPEDRNLLLGDTSLSARPRSWSYSPATPQYDNNDQRPRSSSVVGSTLAFQQDMSTFDEGFATQGQQNTFGFSGNYNTANFNIASSSITPSNYNNNYTAGFDVNSIPTSSSNYDGYNSVGLDLTSSTVPSQQFDNNLGYGLSPLPPSSSVTMDNFQFYGQPTNVDRAPHPHDVSQGLANFSNNLSIPSSSNHRPRSASLGGNSQMEPSHLDHEYAHGAFLDVPVLHAPRALQRKGAHRRGATHTGINHHSHMGAGRGRSLGPPSSRSLSDSRSLDRSHSPYPSPSPSIPGSPLPNSNASSLYGSPSIPALPSEALGDIPDLNIMVIPPDDASLGRRHTSAGAGGSGQTDEHQLRRVQSDPFAATRGQKHAAQPTHRRTRSGRGRGGAKSQVMGEMPMMNFAEAGPSNPYAESAEYDPPSPSGGSSNGGDTSFKHQVASGKIVAASHKRRKHPGKFVCEICEADFTAKHNLQNHMNSHQGVKDHVCEHCSRRFTTSAVLTRHYNACSKNKKDGEYQGGAGGSSSSS